MIVAAFYLDSSDAVRSSQCQIIQNYRLELTHHNHFDTKYCFLPTQHQTVLTQQTQLKVFTELSCYHQICLKAVPGAADPKWMGWSDYLNRSVHFEMLGWLVCDWYQCHYIRNTHISFSPPSHHMYTWHQMRRPGADITYIVILFLISANIFEFLHGTVHARHVSDARKCQVFWGGRGGLELGKYLKNIEFKWSSSVSMVRGGGGVTGKVHSINSYWEYLSVIWFSHYLSSAQLSDHESTGNYIATNLHILTPTVRLSRDHINNTSPPPSSRLLNKNWVSL